MTTTTDKDPFGFDQQRERLLQATRRAEENIKAARKLVEDAEQVVADAQEESEIRRIAYEKLATANNDIAEILSDLEKGMARSDQFTESVIGLFLDAVDIKKSYVEFRKHFDTSVSLTLALMSQAHIMAMAMQSQQTIDRMLNQIGEPYVVDWLKRRSTG